MFKEFFVLFLLEEACLAVIGPSLTFSTHLGPFSYSCPVYIRTLMSAHGLSCLHSALASVSVVLCFDPVHKIYFYEKLNDFAFDVCMYVCIHIHKHTHI